MACPVVRFAFPNLSHRFSATAVTSQRPANVHCRFRFALRSEGWRQSKRCLPRKRGVPEGLWLKCPGCGASVYKKEVEQRLNVCPKCEHHFYVSALERIAQVLDDGTFEPMNEHLRPTDPLEFADRRRYADRLVGEQKRTGLTDAVVTGVGMIRARRVAFAVTDSAFIMGSMGSVVG